jgi:transcriptional regulator with XRE-family HTH domain
VKTNVKPAKRNYVPGTSRRPQRAATLLAQVADLERGERIKALREQVLHLTQPVVAERVGVTLRAYQEWEAGGGIAWENAKRLAKVLGATPDFIMSGDREALDLGETQLDRIESLVSGLDEQMRLLRAEQAADVAEVLKRIDEALPPRGRSQDQPPE